MTARSMTATRFNARRLSVVGQTVADSVPGDPGFFGRRTGGEYSFQCMAEHSANEQRRSRRRSANVDENQAKITEKPTENHRKIDRNPWKIGNKSLLGVFGRPKLLRGRAGTRSGPARDGQKPPPGRSWGRRGTPRAAKTRPKPGPSRPEECPGRPRSVARAWFLRQALSNSLPDRFFMDFACLREAPM